MTYSDDCVLVPWQDGAQVDQFTGDIESVLSHLGHLSQHVDLGAPANQCHVATWEMSKVCC